ncbi:MAG: hypothetical protein VR65_02565 [Desulfobulbaceae bacterium BRH_c16a]|nr:MAG: hypothetical protein VR65_02565 [Desulfobulbaceae bacterium BRH_c16a]
MQCERLLKMIKSWYLSVRQETMAPARMVSFMEQHAATCEVCLRDPDLPDEIAKITELVLPESKIPKAVRQSSLDDEMEPEDDSFVDSEEEDENLDEDLEEEEDIEEDEFLEEDDSDEV